jgi:hypothetical protein
MWPHTAAIGRNTDHDVIKSPARQEFESIKQRCDRRHPLIDGLHEQRPVAIGQISEARFFEGAVLAAILVVVDGDDPRIRIAFACDTGQFIAVNMKV